MKTYISCVALLFMFRLVYLFSVEEIAYNLLVEAVLLFTFIGIPFALYKGYVFLFKRGNHDSQKEEVRPGEIVVGGIVVKEGQQKTE